MSSAAAIFPRGSKLGAAGAPHQLAVDLRCVALAKMEDHTNQEIAAKRER